MKIYVASSWRNDEQPNVVKMLRDLGHGVYDFKNPAPGDNGFHWSEIDPKWRDWENGEFIVGLAHPLADKGFSKDMQAMHEADVCVLVLPCGKSAHLEAGWFAGQGKPCVIYLNEYPEPELMYKMCTALVVGPTSLADVIGRIYQDRGNR